VPLTKSAILDALDPTARTLEAGELRAVFLPGLGMLGASLEQRGEELLGRVEDIKGFITTGKTCGIPLLHPWANRLGEMHYQVDGRQVSLEGSPLIGRDSAGLPMHGVPWPRLAWQVRDEGARSLRAQLEWNSPELLAVFPFPHRLEMDVALEAASLTITTTLVAGADRAVPVSFGFHPYFRIPGVPRSEWRVRLPAMQHLALDARHLPTGSETAVPAQDTALGEREYDDGFRLDSAPASFSLAGGGRRITIEFLQGFPYAQVFAPTGGEYTAFEPMTAPPNALVTGRGLRMVAPGQSFRAAFRVILNGGS
jgi:aldose 1-epimerase